MMAVLCVPFSFIANWLVDSWPFGLAMCPAVSYLQTVSVFLSAFTLVGLINGQEWPHESPWFINTNTKSHRGWSRGQQRPRMYRRMTYHTNGLARISLVGLSVDRFRAVVFPLRPRVTARQVLTAIVAIWLLALAIPLPVPRQFHFRWRCSRACTPGCAWRCGPTRCGS